MLPITFITRSVAEGNRQWLHTWANSSKPAVTTANPAAEVTRARRDLPGMKYPRGK
jgi:hypothetical protein